MDIVCKYRFVDILSKYLLNILLMDIIKYI